MKEMQFLSKNFLAKKNLITGISIYTWKVTRIGKIIFIV